MPNAALFLLLILPISAAASSLPLDAPNCSLSSPPSNAGEDKPHGALMKFYPRAKDIPASYTGCQIVWLLRDGQWITFSRRYYAAGTLSSFYGPQLGGTPTSVCLFQNGKLSPDSKGACPSFEEANRPAPSLAPGCITARKTAECSKYE
jgi:hypothetical protein